MPLTLLLPFCKPTILPSNRFLFKLLDKSSKDTLTDRTLDYLHHIWHLVAHANFCHGDMLSTILSLVHCANETMNSVFPIRFRVHICLRENKK